MRASFSADRALDAARIAALKQLAASASDPNRKEMLIREAAALEKAAPPR